VPLATHREGELKRGSLEKRSLTRDRGFESCSLHRRVGCEPDFLDRAATAGAWVTQEPRRHWRSSFQRSPCRCLIRCGRVRFEAFATPSCRLRPFCRGVFLYLVSCRLRGAFRQSRITARRDRRTAHNVFLEKSRVNKIINQLFQIRTWYIPIDTLSCSDVAIELSCSITKTSHVYFPW
jgi:hypothetical protein